MSSLIRVFEIRVPEITDLSEDPDIPPTALASRITDTIMERLEDGSLNNSFPVDEMEINDRAQVHCEKWVEEVGYHFTRYSTATQTPGLAYPNNQSTNRYILKSKVYSGDVSGTIGESLFSLYLIKCFSLSDGDFAHLRADNSSVYPDFGIYNPSPQMLSNFQWSPILDSEIPAEVKSANEFKRSSIHPQVRKSIRQIRAFWRRRGTIEGSSMIGVTIRNQRQQTYDLVVIWR